MVMTRIVYDVKYQAGLAREAGSRVPGSYGETKLIFILRRPPDRANGTKHCAHVIEHP